MLHGSLCCFAGLEKTGVDGTTACSEILTPTRFFCYGCGEIVCENHDVAKARVTHRHSPLSHLDHGVFVRDALKE